MLVITPGKSSKKYLFLQVSHEYCEVVVSLRKAAELKYTEGSRSIEIVPKADGGLKLASKTSWMGQARKRVQLD